jgi:hypothetical protein
LFNYALEHLESSGIFHLTDFSLIFNAMGHGLSRTVTFSHEGGKLCETIRAYHGWVEYRT